MGKGSTRRPKSISDKQLQDNWNRIFNTANRKGADDESDRNKSTTRRQKNR